MAVLGMGYILLIKKLIKSKKEKKILVCMEKNEWLVLLNVGDGLG